MAYAGAFSGQIQQNMRGRFSMRDAYNSLQMHNNRVSWRSILYHNIARPRAIFILWLACNGRLATKDRLRKFGMLESDECCFCHNQETIQHLLFECHKSKAVWKEVLDWLQIQHEPLSWDAELAWITQICKRRKWRGRILVCAVAETIYAIWRLRNDTVFGHDVKNSIGREIIDTIVYRCWENVKLRPHLATQMI
ncbi:uncharacterized protein LOC131651476 [Vicia villosa]|uniref:uncharacterized protein LOC131651476 n=1 Tax=Vicia villosa TaxID=3911 RepID=UPI00273CA1C6|nr:uncharacterized protein LOC131651476 [Vicia villosa]